MPLTNVIRGLESIGEQHRGVVVTIGNFDGVHLGHQKIISAVLDKARSLKAASMAITFDPHPVKVLSPERGLNLLTPPDEKARLLRHYGVDYVLFINFSREFSNMKADDFISSVLVAKLGVKSVIVGHGYAFGKAKQGTTELLRKRGGKYGFSVHVVRNAKMLDKDVSSSRIRLILSRGKVAKAAMLLGRPYAIAGTVIKGAGRGASVLHTPTANITTPNEMIPLEGVYAVRVMVDGALYDGAANIGKNPTFGINEQSYEVHIFDYSGDLRGKCLRMEFIERLRDEITFPSAEALKAQIDIDIARAKAVLGAAKNNPA